MNGHTKHNMTRYCLVSGQERNGTIFEKDFQKSKVIRPSLPPLTGNLLKLSITPKLKYIYKEPKSFSWVSVKEF